MWQFLVGLGLGAFFLIAYIFISTYKNIRAFVADILASLGFLGKWVRKKSVESRYENIINGAVDVYNSNFEGKILSNCKINLPFKADRYYDWLTFEWKICIISM